MTPSGDGAPGTLYVVATPIGNLEDITLRALRVLREVDLIAAEDTRHSRKLLGHYGIATPLTPYHDHNESTKAELLLARLRAGQSLALISDAGTPGIADPGYRLVSRCRAEGLPVSAIPGPSAAIAALSISGLPTDAFVFAGFLPARSGARRAALRALRRETRTTLFYEAPHRLAATLRDLVAELGEERRIALVRELTKLHEEWLAGPAAELCRRIEAARVRGELVLLVAPAAGGGGEEAAAAATLEMVLQELLAAGIPLRQAVKEAARQFGLPGDQVYRRALALRAGADNNG